MSPPASIADLGRCSVSELVELALIEDSRGEDVRNEPLVILQDRGTREVLDTGMTLCRSPEPLRRRLGAVLLGQLGSPRSFPEECCDALLNLVRHDPDPAVMTTAIFALGHLGNPRCQPDLIKLRNHPRDQVRYGVAFSFGEPQTEEAVLALMELMRDGQARVRDWATTFLGQATAFDSPAIRAALIESAGDEDELVRVEGLRGLVYRQDPRAGPMLLRELGSGSDYSSYFEDAAKSYLGLDEEAHIERESLLGLLRSYQAGS